MSDIFQGAPTEDVQARRKEYINMSLKDFYHIAAKTIQQPEVFVNDPITVQDQFAPHRPPDRLPVGKLAVVLWMWGGVCLLVDGKVGIREGIVSGTGIILRKIPGAISPARLNERCRKQSAIRMLVIG